MTTNITLPRATVAQALEACEQRLPLKGQAAIIDELNNLRAALAQQAEPVDTDCHTQGICQRSGYGIGRQSDPQIEDRLARHGIPKP